MDKVSPASLEWALTHVKKYGDTDIFPVPFEFEAIAHSWTGLRSELEREELKNYITGTGRRMLIPKPNGGFRVAVQLDPLDTLVYTAMVFEAAELIEQHRISVSQKVACSYRIKLDARGSFFPAESGWSDFHSRSEELAKSGEFTHVLIADIVDFYNQLYQHRIENALEAAAITVERAKNVEHFLSKLSAKQSRGLPVGPIASIILAEICLNDVDTFLLRKGAPHVRYVDDFRIFCRSRREAILILHDLTEYLYTAHRLPLELAKTKIISVKKFIGSELRDPEEEEKQAKLQEMAEELEEATGYRIDPLELSEEDEAVALRESLSELFQECVTTKPLHLGLARHVLRKATGLRTAVLISPVFETLEILAPVFRDVARYIIRCLPKDDAQDSGPELVDFLQKSDIGQLPFIRMWGLEILDRRPEMVSIQASLKLAEDSAAPLGLRPLALLAGNHNQLDWLRAQKEIWNNHGPWDRRAVIWASRALPRGERRRWLKVVEESGDHLDRAVAQFAAIQ